mgnify:CR=1 FL=1
MRAEVLAWMQAQRMTEPGDTVVCAVSGGADSVSMLHVLLSLQDTLGIRVEAAHFNHHLRGAESDRDEAFVRQLCASLGVPLHTGGGDVQARAASRPRFGGMPVSPARPVPRVRFRSTVSRLSSCVCAVAIKPDREEKNA